MASDMTEYNAVLVHVFVILQIVGCFAFALMVFSSLIFASVKRHPVWYNFCVSWIIFGVSYSLLSFAGQQFSGRAERVCSAQAAMVYAAPFIAGCASLMLVLQLLLTLFSALSDISSRKSYPVLATLIIVLPWVVWAAVLAAGIVFVIRNPEEVEMSHNGTFCVVTKSPIPRLTAVGSAVFGVSVVILEALIGYILYQNRAIKDVCQTSVGMLGRMVLLTILALTAAVTGLAFAATHTRGIAFDVMIAILPISAAIIFGTQRDLWVGYFCWMRCGGVRHRAATPPRTRASVLGPLPVLPTISIDRGSLMSIVSIPDPPPPSTRASTGDPEAQIPAPVLLPPLHPRVL